MWLTSSEEVDLADKKAERIVRTTCGRMDHGGCGLLVHVLDGRPVDVEGDPESPLSRGHICGRARAALEKNQSEARLTTPLRRCGERGDGRYEAIGWGEAIREIATRMGAIRQELGPQYLGFCQGSPKGLEHFLLLRLANVFGSPNVCGPQHVCHFPREMAGVVTCGFMPTPDYDGRPDAVLVWGSQLDVTNEEGIICSKLFDAVDQGAKLVVIDPRRSRLAERADLHLQIEPGGDASLALWMLDWIIRSGSHDSAFVEQWCTGLDELRDHLAGLSDGELLGRAGLPEASVRQCAEMYADAERALIQWGNGIENTVNAFQTARALVLLMAVTGNLDVRGGNLRGSPPPTARLGSFVRARKLGDLRSARLSSGDRILPTFPVVPSHMVTRSLLEEVPYRLRGLYVHDSNPLVTWSDTRRVEEALRRLDLLVVSDIFMTPTAALADYVLPAATQLEIDDIGHYGLPHGFITARPKVVEPPGEAKPDLQILCELGRALGHVESFPEEYHDVLAEVVEPSGMSYEDLARRGWLQGEAKERSYEKKGFKTPSKKVELFSSVLERHGFEPMPTPGPDTGAVTEEFPIRLISAKSKARFLSLGRQLETVRRMEPEPVVSLHPETAASHGLGDGAWVWIETEHGRIRQKLRVDDRVPRAVACAAAGWCELPDGFRYGEGWARSSFNVLTSQDEWGGELGTSVLRPLRCRMRPVD